MPKEPKRKSVRVRIAPSPTGPLHIGTARSALFNYLFARQNKGKFILRIEDTDLERSEERWEKNIIENLKWLGMDYDEGPTESKEREEYGPYRQSQRIASYRSYLEKLLKKNQAYYCYCTEKALADERTFQRTKGEPPRYSGKCANLTPAQIKQFKKQECKPVIRFKIPAQKITFDDLIRGQLTFDATLLGDPIIAKDLNAPLYNFAVVVDDYLMKITHVIRGEDHIANTPKQIAMQEALGFPRPQYAHLPLILNPDRSKMSKRQQLAGGQVIPVTIQEFKEEGYLPEALINYMAFLGWSPKDNREIFSLQELIAEFSLAKVNKGGAVFNLQKLNDLNGYYLRQMPLKNLTQLILKQNLLKYNLQDYSQEYIEKAIATVQERLKKLSEVQEYTRFYFEKIDYPASLLQWKKMTAAQIEQSLEIAQEVLKKTDPQDFTPNKLEEILRRTLEREKIGAGEFLWPLRVALTGLAASPSPFEVAWTLGKDESLRRVTTAIKKLSKK